jgi:hypothetical protein
VSAQWPTTLTPASYILLLLLLLQLLLLLLLLQVPADLPADSFLQHLPAGTDLSAPAQWPVGVPRAITARFAALREDVPHAQVSRDVCVGGGRGFSDACVCAPGGGEAGQIFERQGVFGVMMQLVRMFAITNRPEGGQERGAAGDGLDTLEGG